MFYRLWVWIQLPDCSELAINWKNDNDTSIYWYDVIVNFFWGCFVSFVKFSYWFKFHPNIITGSRVMTIYFHKELTRNPEMGNTRFLVLPNILRMGQVRNTKFGTDVSNKMLLNAAKCQGYNVFRFWVFKRKPTRRVSSSQTILMNTEKPTSFVHGILRLRPFVYSRYMESSHLYLYLFQNDFPQFTLRLFIVM